MAPASPPSAPAVHTEPTLSPEGWGLTVPSGPPSLHPRNGHCGGRRRRPFRHCGSECVSLRPQRCGEQGPHGAQTGQTLSRKGAMEKKRPRLWLCLSWSLWPRGGRVGALGEAGRLQVSALPHAASSIRAAPFLTLKALQARCLGFRAKPAGKATSVGLVGHSEGTPWPGLVGLTFSFLTGSQVMPGSWGRTEGQAGKRRSEGWGGQPHHLPHSPGSKQVRRKEFWSQTRPQSQSRPSSLLV